MSANTIGQLKRSLPTDQLSEHSIKFYDGTYKWDSEGFENEHGVYHNYSDEPECRPPTPLPPAPLSDFGDDLLDGGEVSPTRSHEASIRTSGSQWPNNGYDGLCGGADGDPHEKLLPLQLCNTLLADKQHAGDINSFTHEKALPHKDLLQDRDNSLSQQQPNGSQEDSFLSPRLGIDVSLKEAYSPVNVQHPDNIAELIKRDQKKSVDNTAGPPVDQMERFTGEPAKSPFSDISGMTDVSDPPSDLEDIEKSQRRKLVITLKYSKSRARIGVEYSAPNRTKPTVSKSVQKQVRRGAASRRQPAGSTSDEYNPLNSDEDLGRPKKGKAGKKVGSGIKRTKRKKENAQNIKDNDGDGKNMKNDGDKDNMEQAQVGAPGYHSQNPDEYEGEKKAPNNTSGPNSDSKNDGSMSNVKDINIEPDAIKEAGVDTTESPNKKQKMDNNVVNTVGADLEVAPDTSLEATSNTKKIFNPLISSSTTPMTADSQAARPVKKTKVNSRVTRASRRSTNGNIPGLWRGL